MHPEQMMQLAELRHQEALVAADARRRLGPSRVGAVWRSGRRGGFPLLRRSTAQRRHGNAASTARQPDLVRSALPPRIPITTTGREATRDTDSQKWPGELRQRAADDDQAMATERAASSG
jgi:hypothetical protein